MRSTPGLPEQQPGNAFYFLDNPVEEVGFEEQPEIGWGRPCAGVGSNAVIIAQITLKPTLSF
ncbi:MAG TPA: hypothetical protein VIF64_17760 [Pyrinomonadaceae bacterium]|jgi:hypothetical protein